MNSTSLTEPKVGGGRIWYNEAFTYFPLRENGDYAESR